MAGPFVFCDLAAGDVDPDFTNLEAMSGSIGAILKASDGVSYDSSWFEANWGPLRAAGGDRAGSTWFRGAYHFLRPTESGADQAAAYLAAVSAAGGLLADDVLPIVDIEDSPSYTWPTTLARQIAGDFAAAVYAATGRTCGLYADGDLGVLPVDGFAWIWTPHPKRLASWPVELMLAFQYAGDGSYYDGASQPAQDGFPLAVPGWTMLNGKPGVDMNVVMAGGVYATDIAAVASALTGNAPSFWRVAGLTVGGMIAAKLIYDIVRRVRS